MSDLEPNKIIHLILPGMFLLTAIIDGIAALVLYKRAKRKYAKYRRTKGIIIDMVEEKDGGVRLIYPIIKFSTHDAEYEARNEYGKSHWNVTQNDRVAIFYNSEDPNKAMIESPFIQNLMPNLMAAATALALVASLVSYILTG